MDKGSLNEILSGKPRQKKKLTAAERRQRSSIYGGALRVNSTKRRLPKQSVSINVSKLANCVIDEVGKRNDRHGIKKPLFSVNFGVQQNFNKLAEGLDRAAATKTPGKGKSKCSRQNLGGSIRKC